MAADSWYAAYFALAILAGVASWFFVPQRRSPSSALAWIFFIALVPLLGLLAFLIIGNAKLPKKRRQRQREMDDLVKQRVAAARAHPDAAHLFLPKLPAPFEPIATLAERLGGIPAVGGDTVRLISGYDEVFEEMVRAIDSARAYVHFQFYILTVDESSEPVIEALEAAVRRGIKVRVLFDHIGSVTSKGYGDMLRRFTASGIEWHRLLPVLPFDGQYARVDLRNHRKIVVIDGVVSFSGSQNIVERGYHHPPLRFTDTMSRVDGPAASAIDTVFRADWYAETGVILEDDDPHVRVTVDLSGTCVGQVLPSGPAHTYSNNLRVIVSLVYAARRRIEFVNPYFVPNAAILTAITSAAQRGVDVLLVTHEVGDNRFLAAAQRSYYDELLSAGVRIVLMPHPEVLHSKTLLIDEDVAMIGSSNLDTRSLFLHLEVDTLWYDVNVVRDLDALQRERRKNGRELGLAEWRRRPLRAKAAETLARVTADLL